MGLFTNALNKKLEKEIRKIESENKRKDFSNNKKNADIKNFIIKTVGFINNMTFGRDKLSEPEYNFEEIKRASETDSYIKIALEKQSRLIYKAGYYLKSENEEAVTYLKTRFRVMGYATFKPIDVLYLEIAEDMIKYSNTFLIKTRVPKIMNGVKANGLTDAGPIGGYFRVDPSTVFIKRDDCGNILGYVQKIENGKEKKFKVEDVIHIYMDKETDNAFGTPKIVAALEDVKLLRKLEGNVLAIVHRFAMPIFHWKIGKTEQGFQATDKEIDDAKYEIENMSLDGVVITNEKTEINVLGAEGNAIDISNYLAYFEQRVFTALDSSASQMGRGGAKQDADSMEAQLHDYVKHVQHILSIFIENFILNELLLEGGFNPILNEKDIVQYVFNEISLETKIKVENHEMLKYQSNLQTVEEARRNIGYKEVVEEERLYKNLIEVPAQVKINKSTADAQGEWTMAIAKMSAQNTASSSSSSSSSSSTGTSLNGKKKSQSPSKAATNNNRPTNQHGTTSAKVKEEMTFNEKVIRNKKKHKTEYKDIYDKIEKFKNNIVNTETDIEYLMAITKDSLIQDIKILINKNSNDGVNLAVNDLNKINVNSDNEIVNDFNLNIFYSEAEKTIVNILKDMKKRLTDREFETVDIVISSLEYRFRFLLEYLLPKVYWYSYLKTGAKFGVENVKVQFGDSSDSEKHDSIISTTNFKLDDIPAFHPFCDCKLKFLKGGNE